MTDPDSLETIAFLLRAIPGVESASVSRDTSRLKVFALVRCLDIAAIDLLAYCGTATNVCVTVSEIDSYCCGEPETARGLPCEILFSDELDELPTECQIFGFFIAGKLYARGIIDDAFLDSLEPRWHVHFSRRKE